jgi:hypothetical protein
MPRRYRRNPTPPDALTEAQFITAGLAALTLAGVGLYLVATNTTGGTIGVLGNVGTASSLATFA